MKIINPYRRFRGAFIPNAIMEYREISQSAKLLWARLAQHAGEDGDCRPSLKKVAAEIGLGESAARDALRQLERQCLLLVKERIVNNQQRSNQYFFLDHEIFHDQKSLPPETGTRGAGNRGVGVQETGGWGCRKPETEENPLRESGRDFSSSGQENCPDGAAGKPKKYHGTDEDHDLAKRIYEAVLVVNATIKEPNWDRWANSIRLMREQDKRSHDEIWHVFDWANRDSFWCSNILSPDKLREKYPQLAPKAGIVRKMRPDARKVRVAADDRKCGACVWLGSGKWFCRAGDGDHERAVAGCDFYRTKEAETLPL